MQLVWSIWYRVIKVLRKRFQSGRGRTQHSPLFDRPIRDHRWLRRFTITHKARLRTIKHYRVRETFGGALLQIVFRSRSFALSSPPRNKKEENLLTHSISNAALRIAILWSSWSNFFVRFRIFKIEDDCWRNRVELLWSLIVRKVEQYREILSTCFVVLFFFITKMGTFVKAWTIVLLVKLSYAGKSVDVITSSGLNTLEEEEILRVLSRNESTSVNNFTLIELIDNRRNHTIETEDTWHEEKLSVPHTSNFFYGEF